MKLITIMGSVYKIPDKLYKEVLRDIVLGLEYVISEKYHIGSIECDVTDMRSEEAEHILSDL